MSEGLLETIYEHLETINNLGESFREGFQFLIQLENLPEENQLIVLAEIAYEVDIAQLASKYASRFDQKLDKTIFALSYLKINLETFKEALQEFYTPVLNPEEDQLVWFSPDCSVDEVIKRCLTVGQPGDVLSDLNGIKSLQMARAVTLLKRKELGDITIRDKDIDSAVEIARKAVTTIGDLQLKANIFEASSNQINIRVQQTFNSLADAIPEEQKAALPDVLNRFLNWADSRKEKQMIDVTPEEEAPVKRGRGRPRKMPRVSDYE